MQNKRVVITGMGLVTPLGETLPVFWQNVSSGQSGVGPVTRFDTSLYHTKIAAEIKDFHAEDYLERKEIRHMDRFVQYAMVAAVKACEDADLKVEREDPFRIGVFVGSGLGGAEVWSDQHAALLTKGPRKVSPFFIPMLIPNMAAGQIAIRMGIKGPSTAVVTACASGGNAIGDAMRALQFGEADVMLAGGTEAAITPIGFAGFNSAKAMSERNDEPERASRPFDATRDGFVMGEGAGILVLETLEHAVSRGARIYAELAGYGRTTDAYHVTAPDPEGEGAMRAMLAAVRDAGLQPQDIDYINAHGTSTPLNDAVETLAIKRAFGDHAYRLPISSSKSMLGHLLGAAGAVEGIISILSIVHGLLPPTINYEVPDPACDLDYVPNQARKAKVRTALSNSLGFGGHNATLLFKQYQE